MHQTELPIGIIIQARTGSTRLPGKMIRNFHKRKSILEILIERIKKATEGRNTKIILATTTNPNDLKVKAIANQLGIDLFCGSENNVLQRFIDTAHHFGMKKIIRVCADNMLLDMQSLNRIIDCLEIKEDVDYVAFSTSQGLPTIKTHYGFWAEGVSVSALEKIEKMTEEALFHEHVTNYIYTYPDKFYIYYFKIPTELEKKKYIRLTIDTETDFNNLQYIYEQLVEQELEINIENVIKIVDEAEDVIKKMKQQIELNTK